MGIFDLTGKVAVVTGSTRGIGRALAGDMAAATLPLTSVTAIVASRFLVISGALNAARGAPASLIALSWGAHNRRINAIAGCLTRTELSKRTSSTPARLAQREAVTPFGLIA